MQAKDIAVIPGDGIGPEITQAVLRVVDAAAAKAITGYLSLQDSAP